MRKIIILAAFLLFGLTVPFQAQAVHVSPFMVVFDKNNSAIVTLNNRSNQAKVVTFEWSRRYYNAQGDVDILPEGQNYPGYQPADPYVKFSPRRAILKPKQAQTIRLIAQRPGGMAPGEYRSHFTIKVEDLVEQKVDATKNAGGVSGLVTINVNTGIPVFIRQGETTVNLTMNQAGIVATPDGPALQVAVQNGGSRSLYTDVYVHCQANGPEKGTYVGSLRMYVERKSAQKAFPIGQKLNLSQCAGATAKLYGVRDLEYGGKLVGEMAINTGGY